VTAGRSPQTGPVGALTGRSALVTGGGRGLGASIALALSQAGAELVLVGRQRAALQRHAEKLPGDATLIVADLGDPTAPARVIDEAETATGGLDILVNNAATGVLGPSDQLSADDIDEVLAVNVRAPMLLTGMGAARMAKRGGGCVVNVSSSLSGVGTPGASLYAASKGALDAATRALAAEWGPAGVRVNAVRPGVTRSDMSQPLLSNEAIASHYRMSLPLRRTGEPTDVAQAVLYLVSNAAAYVTGQIIGVDGGWGVSAESILSSGS
jgi:NAD(P)-dependent dehydrogenase (short-subunit alcohol dehydrogenase family)